MRAIPEAMALMLLLPVLACQAKASDPAPTGASTADAAADAVVHASMAGNGKDFCAGTAQLLFEACGHDVLDAFLVSSARCLNVSDQAEREACVEDAKGARAEARTLCQDQRAWRRDACALLGRERYDPVIDPARFDDPRHPTRPSRWFPLAVGDRWEYRSADQVDTIEIVDETKHIAGVDCLVARDVVTSGGDVIEATDDWYAFAKDGNVWYFGEEAKDYESFDGDAPRRPELVSIEGSFKAGRERDKPGIIFQATPKVGLAYLEEFSLANAEDLTEILSTTYAFGRDPDLDQQVPRALAELLCGADDCVVTRNISLLEPGIEARKYYAPGIGVFLEVDPDTGPVQLTSCNVDPRCASLPAP